jgi:hypothetical protein
MWDWLEKLSPALLKQEIGLEIKALAEGRDLTWTSVIRQSQLRDP